MAGDLHEVSVAVGELRSDVATVQRDLAEVKSDVRLLLARRWRTDGMSAVVSAIVGAAGGVGVLLLKLFMGG